MIRRGTRTTGCEVLNVFFYRHELYLGSRGLIGDGDLGDAEIGET